MGRFDNLKRNLKLQTISSKILLSLILGGLFISATTQIIVSKTINDNEIAHIQEIEEQDMSYMEDYISKDGVWHIDNYTLKKGDVTIGDGNISGYNASEIFEQVEEIKQKPVYKFIGIVFSTYIIMICIFIWIISNYSFSSNIFFLYYFIKIYFFIDKTPRKLYNKVG